VNDKRLGSPGHGSHFDPDILDTFVEMSEEFHQIALQYEDHEEVAVSS
jgi:hypothetical protein